MRELSLCIDYSNICFRSMFTCKYTNENISSFDTEDECAVFARKVITDIAALVKLFNPNHVYLFTDSKNPWRKDVCENYKGTRVHDDNLNMKNVFSTVDDVLNILKGIGFRVLGSERGEADDMASLYKDKVWGKLDESLLYVSSDADWLQLVDFDINTKQYLCVYNPISSTKCSNKLNCTKECVEWLYGNSDSDIFCSYSNTKRKLLEAQTYNTKIKIVMIDPNKVLMDKILFGDDGDNVPAFFQYYKNGKKVRLTEKKLVKVMENCGEFSRLDELNSKIKDGTFIDGIGKVFKCDAASMVDGITKLESQRSCVELNPCLFPEGIISGFNESYNLSMMNESYVYPRMKRMEDIVSGTKYEVKKHTDNGAKLNKIFADFIDKPLLTHNDLF